MKHCRIYEQLQPGAGGGTSLVGVCSGLLYGTAEQPCKQTLSWGWKLVDEPQYQRPPPVLLKLEKRRRWICLRQMGRDNRAAHFMPYRDKRCHKPSSSNCVLDKKRRLVNRQGTVVRCSDGKKQPQTLIPAFERTALTESRFRGERLNSYYT